MKRTIKLSLIGGFALCVALVGLGSARSTGTASETNSPRTLYVQNCARCHGLDGRANTKMGRKLEAADLTSSDVQEMDSARIARAIRNGRPGMPAFGRKLRPSQVSAIAEYVRSF